MANIQIGSMGVKKSLSRYKPLKALMEYIWNGFDAQATSVEVTCIMNELDTVAELLVKDNGYGISKEKLKDKFTPFFESEKLIDPDEVRKVSAVHGKNGVGRLTFFKFSDVATWTTVYKINEKKYKYDISIRENNLQEYYANEEKETDEMVGTIVKFEGVSDIYSIDEIKDFIIEEFAWFLELNNERGFSIKVNGEGIDYSKLIEIKSFSNITYEKTTIEFQIKYIVWKRKLQAEYSYYYFIDSSGKEVLKETTSLNNKGDKFYHSVYVKSPIFNNFFSSNEEKQLSILGYSKASDEFIYLKEEIDKDLKKLRKPFIKRYTDVLIDDLEKSKAFPEYDSNNFIDKMKRNELELIVREVYIAQPKIFSNLNVEQKKTIVRFLDLIMQSGEVDNLLSILKEVVDLDSEDREELATILNTTKMSNIIKTIKLIEDRYKAINELKQLVFNEGLYANEVYHLQHFIEKHYWIFGEQYHLVTSAEPDFEEALRRYIYYLTGQKGKRKIDHPDKNKEMDIFAVRQVVGSDEINNIVVELKHPNVSLGEKQLNQVKKYMNVISKQQEFNAPNMKWEFYLVGNKFDTSKYIENEIKSNQNHGEKSLVFKLDRYKIYVKTWSEIFSEFEIRHKYINEKLQLERQQFTEKITNADEVIKNLDKNTAIQLGEVAISRE